MGKFHVFQRIPTNGARGVHYFAVSPRKFLAVTNEQSAFVSIYEWLNGSFSANIQDIKIKEPQKCTTFDIDDDTYMACGRLVGTNTTIVLKWNKTGFNSFQVLPSSYAISSLHSFEANGSVFLAVPGSSFLPAYIYRWNGASFVLHQSLTTTNAKSLESFVAENETFLAVSSAKYAMADVYKMTGNNLALYQKLQATTSSEFASFTHMGRRYLVIANYRQSWIYNINSTVYIWT